MRLLWISIVLCLCYEMQDALAEDNSTIVEVSRVCGPRARARIRQRRLERQQRRERRRQERERRRNGGESPAQSATPGQGPTQPGNTPAQPGNTAAQPGNTPPPDPEADFRMDNSMNGKCTCNALAELENQFARNAPWVVNVLGGTGACNGLLVNERTVIVPSACIAANAAPNTITVADISTRAGVARKTRNVERIIPGNPLTGLHLVAADAINNLATENVKFACLNSQPTKRLAGPVKIMRWNPANAVANDNPSDSNDFEYETTGGECAGPKQFCVTRNADPLTAAQARGTAGDIADNTERVVIGIYSGRDENRQVGGAARAFSIFVDIAKSRDDIKGLIFDKSTKACWKA